MDPYAALTHILHLMNDYHHQDKAWDTPSDVRHAQAELREELVSTLEGLTQWIDNDGLIPDTEQQYVDVRSSDYPNNVFTVPRTQYCRPTHPTNKGR